MLAHLTLGEVPWLIIGSLVFGASIVAGAIAKLLDR